MKEKNNSESKPSLRGEKHVLFKKQVPAINMEIPQVTEATFYLSTFDENKTSVAALLNEIQQLNPEDKITLVINSPGGLITEGRALINAFLNTGAEIKTELISEAASMAAIMFCIGHKRIVHESTSMMFHNFSTGYMGKGDEIKDYIKHATKNNLAFFRAHILGLSEEEIYRMVDGKEWWFDTKKMCQRGIATHVNVNGLIIPATKYLKILKKTKKTAKKVLGKDIKINSLREALIYKIDALSPIAEEKQKTFQEIQTQIAEMVETYDHDDS